MELRRRSTYLKVKIIRTQKGYDELRTHFPTPHPLPLTKVRELFMYFSQITEILRSSQKLRENTRQL